MGKYFGTDGVRGIANQELTPELAYKIGRCGGFVLAGQADRPRVIIGRDTRISGPLLEAALVAGLLSIGADVIRLGVLSTPGVAYLTRKLQADAGVMISASHNPVEDNGIKFFGADGFKLSDETELEIEKLLEAEEDLLPRPIAGGVGTVADNYEAKYEYSNYIKSTVKSSFSSLKIVLDCAHGAAYELAPKIFRELGAEVISTGDAPNGVNINDRCGSTHPETLAAEVLRHQADLGLSFDGDADRLIAIDDKGEEVDGDYILTIVGEAMKLQGRLSQDTVVTTVMSNLGFFKAAQELGFRTARTAVGDRYVMEEMRKGGYNLGGEQSGHLILLDYNTTGDGILSALHLVDTIIQSGKKLSELKLKMQKFPQVLVNVKGVDKSKLKGNAAIEQAIQEVEAKLGEDGRVLVRPSGTEALVRVMVEGPDKALIEDYAGQIAEVIRQELA
ncbi:phosphoglucosamine mutase [Paenibacillus sp. J2TS4]|uniref:phosphoglucosamine mutase n=1 Tax=Paenibacillus sp. J2TS4 TaxID=2807194 RepID=UPI001B146019|nr:phosphoglucosamine mutase [Paenibacillus sp. J2TS4]GIP34955.1 phosphoglucosamine mutase [Paenibacillus sp. J2TS4]